jgi:hypothetical protein
MIKLLIACFIAALFGFAIPTSAQERQTLKLVQTIPLPGVTGRLDHMGVDLEKKRLFVAAVANNTLEVVDLTEGKVIKSLAGFKDTQDALFLGGDFNKLYVSSLDGHVRVFQGESFWLVRDFKIEPDPNRLFFDPATKLIYFGYGGQNAGFDAYERVGILQPKPGAGSDQLVADMVAPTPRPGHLAEMAMDDNGILLVCDSRADRIYQFDTQKRELIKSWPARGDGAGDIALDRTQHRLFVGTRTPPEMTVYDSQSGKEIQSLPGPETMDGVHYDANLKRVYMTGGRCTGRQKHRQGGFTSTSRRTPTTTICSPRLRPDPVRALRSSYPNSIAFMSRLKPSAIRKPQYWYLSPCRNRADSMAIWAHWKLGSSDFAASPSLLPYS